MKNERPTLRVEMYNLYSSLSRIFEESMKHSTQPFGAIYELEPEYKNYVAYVNKGSRRELSGGRML